MQWQCGVAQLDKCERPGSDVPTLHFQDSQPDILVTAINAILIIQPLTSSQVTSRLHRLQIYQTQFCAFGCRTSYMWNQIEGCEWLIKHIVIMCATVTAMNYTITRYWPHTGNYGQAIVNSVNISFLESSEEMKNIMMLPWWLDWSLVIASTWTSCALGQQYHVL